MSIPDSVTSIGDEAFAYCYSLTDMTIPDSVTSIGESAFCLCSALTDFDAGKKNFGAGKKKFGAGPCCFLFFSLL